MLRKNKTVKIRYAELDIDKTEMVAWIEKRM